MNRWTKQAMYKRMRESKVSKKLQDGLFDAYLTMKARREQEDDKSRETPIQVDDSVEILPTTDS